VTRSGPDQGRTDRSLSLTTGGLTLLGVILSIGFTVGFGVNGPLWLRLLSGLGSILLLVAIVKLGTAAGRGPIARLADWVIGADQR
jgi:hypothetical protein